MDGLIARRPDSVLHQWKSGLSLIYAIAPRQCKEVSCTLSPLYSGRMVSREPSGPETLEELLLFRIG